MTDLNALIAEYRALRTAEEDTYSEDNFPGSRAWLANQRATIARRAFAKAHPEVIAAIKAVRQAPAYTADQGSLYNRALRGQD